MTDASKLPSLRQIQMWAWRRDNKRFPTPSTVGEAAKRFKVTPEQIADIVGVMDNNKSPYFFIVGDSRKTPIADLEFEHDGE